jgi:hypothetical protein
MKKADRELLDASLDKALAPRKPRRDLNAILDEYDDDTSEPGKVAPPDPPLRGVTPRNPTRPVAPAKDFNKRANSLDKLALPAGLFPGASKSLYDALYVRTRGAVVPTRTIRATKRELCDWSGIRNVKTVDSHLRYFSAIGLVISEWERGQNDGSLYEVLLPEETRGLFVGSRGVTPPDPMLPHPTPPDPTSPRNPGSPHPQNLGSPHPTDLSLESTASETSKTSLKTNTEGDDDEAFADLFAVLKQAAKKVTGREPSPAERARWKEVAELLATELEVAASRTTVTSAPAFLAEHLRRRLRKADARQIEREVGEASSKQAASTAKPELTPEQIQEQVNLMAGLMRDGAEMKELEEQFAPNFRPSQWHMIRSIALAQASVSATKPKETEK